MSTPFSLRTWAVFVPLAADMLGLPAPVVVRDLVVRDFGAPRPPAPRLRTGRTLATGSLIAAAPCPRATIPPLARREAHAR